MEKEPGMPRNPHHRLEDWMRLILLHWILISMIMFYSIVMGTAGGCAVVLLTAAFVEGMGLSPHFFHLYPTPGTAAVVVIGGLIATLFLHLFKHLRYNCASGTYTLAVSRAANQRAIAGLALITLALIGIGAGVSWLMPE
jgi:hypothetical protein